jgi:hypothetical protein
MRRLFWVIAISIGATSALLAVVAMEPERVELIHLSKGKYAGSGEGPSSGGFLLAFGPKLRGR